MKIRNGFVSNSSSSSFCILGFQIDIDEISLEKKVDILKKIIDWKEYPERYQELQNINLEDQKERGCDCPENDSKYCTKCGAPMWIKVSDLSDIECNIDDDFRYELPSDIYSTYCSYDGKIYIGLDLARMNEFDFDKNKENIEKLASILGINNAAIVFSGVEDDC